ncbi:hypothetical protein M407DRAFT_34675 [Tulasnella calospora MUT 4182]|uniref:SCP domain-containing protein n=1 Tax=Tulasnella calospora MUT 4182 TaxID=1051891 RepID=A0A0C3L1Y3_9AGAM|nr:hypothetical protein M407DRAFT_34675 [Tulasnella calospora MUT 4182]
MKFSTLYLTSLSFLPSFIAAAAVPDALPGSEEASTLGKRGPEVNYISNCNRRNGAGSYPASYIAWYANQDNSQDGQWADSLSNEYRNWANGGTHLDWTQPQSIHFPDSGINVNTNLESWAWSASVGSYAGTATRTSDGKVFTCYRDTDRQLFYRAPPVPDGTNLGIQCFAAFYCN